MIFAVVLSGIVRQRITDPTSGFRMANRRGIELFARDYPHDYPEVEAILMLHHHRLRIHEVPVKMNARGFGRSSIDYPRSAYYMAKVLLAIFVGLFAPAARARRRGARADGCEDGVAPSTATARRSADGAVGGSERCSTPRSRSSRSSVTALCFVSSSSWSAAGGSSSATRCSG